MKSKITTSLLLLFLVTHNMYSQGLVTLNREKIKTEQAKTKKKKVNTSKSVSNTKSTKTSKRATSKNKRKSTSSAPKVASYLRINNQYGNVTENINSNSCYKTFYIYTDGSYYNVSMMPSWCKVTNKTSNYFTVYIEPNNSHSNRSDWFVVKSDNKEVRTFINQEGKSYSVAANYTSAYLTHNWYINGTQYMKVNATIRISGAKDLKMLSVATIQNEYGGKIYAAYGYSNYSLNDGSFYAASEITPNSDDSRVYNITLYIPNNALRLYKKNNKLTCKLSLYCEKTGGFISNVNYTIPFKAKNKKGKVTTKNR